MKKVVCKKCCNDTTVRGITFNEAGVCNFCLGYEAIKDQLHDYAALEANFLKRLNKERGKHKYDVALGISGGKDSTYVLYKLVKEYKLNVITYTLDNGFLSDEAKRKIDKLVKELGVEHEYVECSKEVLRKIYNYIIKRYISPCIACSYLGYAVMINYATKVDAAVGMHGRSIPQMLRGFSLDREDTFKPFILAGLKDIDTVDLEELYETSLAKISRLIDADLAKEIEDNLLVDAKASGYRDFISYFLYHPYKQEEIVSFISKQTSWKVESTVEHFDCLIHNGALYLKNIIARRPHSMPEVSCMIKEGHLTKEEGMALMKQKNIKQPKNELKMLCKFAKINKTKLVLKAKIYGLRWWRDA